MARAKRTSDRAEARRRYRQTPLVDDEAPESEARPSPASSKAAATATATARPSFTASFRSAYHRADLRGDLPYLPSLLRHWSFWLPLLLMVGSGIFAVILPRQPNGVAPDALHGASVFLYQTFVLPPALIVLFICGFFAKRASYLLGAILGVINAILFGLLLTYAVQAGLSGLSSEEVRLQFVNALILSPPSGVLFTSLAAWYKRFLALTNPNRGRRPPPKGRPKPARGR